MHESSLTDDLPSKIESVVETLNDVTDLRAGSLYAASAAEAEVDGCAVGRVFVSRGDPVA